MSDLDDSFDSLLVLNTGNLFSDNSSASSNSSRSSTSSEESDSDDAYEADDEDDEPIHRSYQFWKRTVLKKSSQLNPRQFLANFRMLPETFESLFQEVKEFLPIGRSTNGKNLLPQEKLLTFLWYAGSNSTFSHGEYAHEMSFGSCWNRQVVFFTARYRGVNKSAVWNVQT
jgi:hypothetical protein